MYPESLSSDGRLLIYRHGLTATSLGVLDLQSGAPGQPLPVSEANALNADVSPDGLWIAYQSDETGDDRIYVRPFPNVEAGRWQISRPTGVAPKWSPDGRELFYRDPTTATMMAVEVSATGTELRAGSPKELFDASPYLPGEIGRNYDVGPDGRFLMVKPASPNDEARVVLIEDFGSELERLLPRD